LDAAPGTIFTSAAIRKLPVRPWFPWCGAAPALAQIGTTFGTAKIARLWRGASFWTKTH